MKSVLSLISFKGRLYASTDKGIFVYNEKAKWINIGNLPGKEEVWSFVIYKDRLYAGAGGVYLYNETKNTWKKVGRFEDEDWSRSIGSLVVFGGKLYAGEWCSARIYVYNEEADRWEEIGNFMAATQPSSVYSLTVFNGKLYAGINYEGELGGFDICMYNGSEWKSTTEENSPEDFDGPVISLIVFNNKLYAAIGSWVYVYE